MTLQLTLDKMTSNTFHHRWNKHVDWNSHHHPPFIGRQWQEKSSLETLELTSERRSLQSRMSKNMPDMCVIDLSKESRVGIDQMRWSILMDRVILVCCRKREKRPERQREVMWRKSACLISAECDKTLPSFLAFSVSDGSTRLLPGPQLMRSSTRIVR